MFLVGLIILAALGFAAGFLVAAIIFVKEDDGSMYFITDPTDGKEYASVQFNARNISEIDCKKRISLKCYKAIAAPQKQQPDQNAVSH